MQKIRTLIVDDEPLAVRGMKLRLAAFTDVEIIGTCSNGREAVKVIKENKPDLVFLDIQMPGFDGFTVIRSLVGEDVMPLVVFVTAFDQYALDAFNAHALDYLLKPVEDDRLLEAIMRVRDHIAQCTAVDQTAQIVTLLEQQADAPGELISAILEESKSPVEAHRFDAQLRIKDRGHITIVDINKVSYIDAAGDYMCIHTAEKTHILRETMKTMIRRLNPKIFQRVHRSTIVNLDMVQEVKPHSNGECFLKLACGAELKVSRSYKEVVGRFM